LIALLVGLIVARLWTIIQFWPIYRDEPLLIVSLRPSGFALWPGVIAAALTAFANMLRLSLDPARMAAAFAVGLVGGGIVINISAYLTGAALGTVTDVPWAARYFIERVHPVGLYRAAGLGILLTLCVLTLRPQRPMRTVWLALLGYALVHLVADAWLRDAVLWGAYSRNQIVALLLALAATAALALEAGAFARRSSLPENAASAGITPAPEALETPPA